MSDVFVSYARSTEGEAKRIADALRSLGYEVWRDEELPAHRAYAEVIEERLAAAKAVVVLWSAEAVKSQWVRAEAEVARTAGTLVQLSLDGSIPPLPFNQIQCADLADWTGDLSALGWNKIVGSVSVLIGAASTHAPTTGGASAPPPLPSRPSIAVMPFVNLSGDPEQDYFADGMVEEIVAALSRAKSIFVVGSSSSLSLKGKQMSPAEAGRRLGVRYLLEGSVRKAGGRVRIAVKLTEAATGDQVWVDKFDGALEDVFELQDRVAASVAGVIEPNLLMAEIARVGERPTDNPTSYDLYLRGSAHTFSFERDDLMTALDYLHRAIDLDPGYGSALAIAALVHAQVAGGLLAPDERRRHAGQSRELGRRALEAAPNDAQVLACVADSLGVLRVDETAQRGLIDRALALNPASWLGWWESGAYHVATGEMELGIQHLEASLRLDPLSPMRPRAMTWIAAGRLGQGRFAEAIAILSESQQLQPGYTITRLLLAACHGHLGDAAGARRELAALDRTGGDLTAFGSWVYSKGGEPRRLLEEGLSRARSLASAGATPGGARGDLHR